jgi:5,10-methylenetetrahydromethanopterin reductase
MVGIYASSMPAEQLERNGIDPHRAQADHRRHRRRRSRQGHRTDVLQPAERLSVSGSPAECAAKIRAEIAPAGVNHMILAITDRSLVTAFTGMDIDGSATRTRSCS